MHDAGKGDATPQITWHLSENSPHQKPKDRKLKNNSKTTRTRTHYEEQRQLATDTTIRLPGTEQRLIRVGIRNTFDVYHNTPSPPPYTTYSRYNILDVRHNDHISNICSPFFTRPIIGLIKDAGREQKERNKNNNTRRLLSFQFTPKVAVRRAFCVFFSVSAKGWP